MSQQFQYPQQEGQPVTNYQAQTPVGQQVQASPFGQAVGQRFQDSVSQDVIRVVSDLDRLETVSEWAKGQATQRGMHRLARACDDLQDIAHLEKKLVIRQSPFAQPIGEATRKVIQDAISELQQYANQPEVQEALSQAQKVNNDIQTVVSRLQTFGQGATGQSSSPQSQSQAQAQVQPQTQAVTGQPPATQTPPTDQFGNQQFGSM